MLDLGGVRDWDGFTRRLAATAVALLVYRLGAHIPLPGLSSEAVGQLHGPVLERISIFALGITPFITVLILAELVKVLAPRLRRWELAHARNHDKLNRILVALALLAAAAQASGLVLALEGMAGLIAQPGTAFRLTCIATLVAGTAAVIWLADQITRHGLGAGTWLLFVTPWLVEAPHRVGDIVLLVAQESLSGLRVLLALALTALVLAAVTGLIRAGKSTPAMVAACLWPVLLAGALWPWILLGVALLLGGGAVAPAWIDPGSAVALLVLAALVAVFAARYVRAQQIAGAAALPDLATPVLAGALASITIAEIVLVTQLAVPLPLSGHLVIVGAVAMALLAGWWRPPWQAAQSSGLNR